MYSAEHITQVPRFTFVLECNSFGVINLDGKRADSSSIANDVNLRQICNQTSKSGGAPKLGCFCSSYEQDYQIREITTRREFWNLAHDLTLKHNQAKEHFSVKADRKILVPYWVDMSVASHGNLGLLFRNKSFSEVGLDSIGKIFIH